MKKIKRILSLFMCLCLFHPALNVKAEAAPEPSFKVASTKDTITLTNTNTDEIATITYTNNFTSAIIQDFDGSEHHAYTDSNGNICLDGQIVIKKESTNSSYNNLNSTSSLKSSNSYKYVTTYYTSTDVQAGAGGIGLALVGLVPGMTVPAALIGLLASYQAMVSDNVYMKVKQYYNDFNHNIRNIIYMYKNSDYTGYLGTYTEEHTLFS
jgi:hypothetical protein